MSGRWRQHRRRRTWRHYGIDVEVTRRDTDRENYQTHWAMIDNMAETITAESTPTW